MNFNPVVMILIPGCDVTEWVTKARCFNMSDLKSRGDRSRIIVRLYGILMLSIELRSNYHTSGVGTSAHNATDDLPSDPSIFVMFECHFQRDEDQRHVLYIGLPQFDRLQRRIPIRRQHVVYICKLGPLSTDMKSDCRHVFWFSGMRVSPGPVHDYYA